jgi:nucleoside 2-deoxyribosyltransferase
MTNSTKPYVYVAGPLFDEGERWFIEKVDQLIQDNPPKTDDNIGEIFMNDKGGVDRCQVVVANLNGVTTDDGTAWEIGYAYAHNKFIIGLFTDWRGRFPGATQVVNLMLQCSLDKLVRSLDELDEELRGWLAAQQK